MPVIKSSHRKFTDNILYELLVYSEWKQDPDVTKLGLQQHPYGRLISAVTYFLSVLSQPFQYKNSKCSLTGEVTRLKNYQLPWHFAVGEEGKFIAIVQETQLEIRTSRDEYSSIIGKATLAKDPYQQWRRVVWSPDCSMVAVGASNGSVAFYDLLGSNLFNIPSGEEISHWSSSEALAAIFFITTRVKSPKWLSELVLVDYGGRLRSYYISPTEGCLEFHQTSLTSSGVSSVTWHSAHNLLIVSSLPQQSHPQFKKENFGWGLSAWRLLNDYPFYRMAIPSPEQLVAIEGKLGLWSRFASLGSSLPFSVVFKMQASPKGQYLACLHTCGSISIWELPSLRLHRLWNLTEQPAFDVRNPEDLNKLHDLSLEMSIPLDLNWWSEQKIIISRRSGAVSVCNTDDLQNMLGESPEFLCGEPRLSTTCNEQGFLALECESQLVCVKRGQQGFEAEETDCSDEETSSAIKNSSSKTFKITDMEKFQPKRKKTKALQRTYRLLELKSTTPEELYNRKIESEEYDEALALAEAYNLDVDRVYQRQWRSKPVSVQSISEFLGKISKTSWVLHECCDRVPETLLAAKELIKYGLSLTHVAMVYSAIHPEDSHYAGERDFTLLSVSELEDLISKVNSYPVDKLPEEAKLRISTRKKLLQYYDILFMYELILDGEEARFDRDFYDKFRREPPILSALQFARASNDKAVELMLTYLGDEVLPHWLTVLENFPETTNPDSYRSLLPDCGLNADLFPLQQLQIRDKDWCEKKHFKHILMTTCEEDLYELPVPHDPLTCKVVEGWYLRRIYEIERLSCMVDQALQLTILAEERNVKGLEVIHNELILLDVLVYDVELEDVTLSHLEKLSPIQKVQLLMSKCTEETFIEDVNSKLVPYLMRCEKLVPNSREKLFKQFMLSLSEEDLSWILKLLDSQPWDSVVNSLEELVELVLQCIYVYKETDQFETAAAILDCLPNNIPVDTSKQLKELEQRVREVEAELIVANILNKYDCTKSLEYIHKHAKDVSVVENLLLRVARSTGKRTPPASESDWKDLLEDMLVVRRSVFSCIPLEVCFELYLSSVLASGQKHIIQSAVKILCCSNNQYHKQLSFERSVRLVLQAAREYFDSAGNFNDDGIDLAKTCLNLITEGNCDIQEELDLIAALQILNDFNISILPIQVRISPDRLRLVDACLNARPTSYRETKKLVSLAEKLRVFGEDRQKREGVVLVRVAEAALEMKDYYFCADVCYRLVDNAQSIGWEVSQRLGMCREFPILVKRQRLVAFALLHCPTENIQELMETMSELEYEILQRDIGDQVDILNNSFDEDNFEDALTTPDTPTREFLPQLTSKLQNTSNLLTKLTSTDFWKDKLNLRYDRNENKTIIDNSDMSRLGFPSFYAELHPGCYESQISGTYESVSTDKEEWKQLRLTQALLKSALLEQEKIPQSLDALDEVLVQCSKLVFREDAPLALSYLLSLSNIANTQHSFSALPDTLLSLQLAVYFYALSDAVAANVDAIYWQPNQVLSWALEQKGQGNCSDCLVQAITQLTDYEQRKKIEELNCGVNVSRFTSDSQYKYDSILGLALTEDLEQLKVAFDLASSHGVPEFEVALSHIIALLLSPSFQLALDRTTDDRFYTLLKNEPGAVLQKLKENVWPNISHTNYQQLIVYYSILQLVIEEKEVEGLSPREHIKLIKKVKATSTEIDYKRLVTYPQDLLETLRPAFTIDNITSIAKLLKALPHNIRCCLSVSQLYTGWIIEQFKLQCLTSETAKRSVKTFEYLSGFFPKLTASEILQVVQRTVFSEQSVRMLQFETRQQMLNIVIEFCQKQNSNKEWSLLLTSLHKLEQHLVDVSSLQTSLPPEASHILEQLDAACGDEALILQVLDSAAMSPHISLTCLQAMVKLLPSLESVANVMSRLLQSHMNSSTSANIVLTRVEESLNSGVKCDDWGALLEPLTKSAHLESQIRLKAVQLLQRLEHSYSSEVDSCRLVTEAILSCPVDAVQVCDAISRAELFHQLLVNTDLSQLMQLLSVWPSSDNQLYLDLVSAMAKKKEDKLLLHLKHIFNEVVFTEQEVMNLVTKLEEEDCEVFSVIFICLLVKSEKLHDKAVDLFSKLPENIDLPSNTASLLVEAGLTPRIISCQLYLKFIEQLLDEDNQLCQSAADQLMSAGFLAEAGSLYMNYSVVPAALRTFSAALNIISRQS